MRDVVDAHFDKGALSDDVARTIQADNTISLDIRAEAARLAGMHVDDPSDLNEAAWHVVRFRAVPGRYARALRRALKAAAARPVGGELNTLGAAQDPNGQLSRRDCNAEAGRGGADYAKPARPGLRRNGALQTRRGRGGERGAGPTSQAMTEPGNAHDADLKALHAEAEALFASRPNQPVKK